MAQNSRSKKKKLGTLTKGISIDPELYKAAITKAQRESRSFSFVVCRAIARDLDSKSVTAATPLTLDPESSDLIDTAETARLLRISIWTLRRRARKKNDPVRLAKSRLGKQKPMQFHRSKIEMIERGVAA